MIKYADTAVFTSPQTVIALGFRLADDIFNGFNNFIGCTMFASAIFGMVLPFNRRFDQHIHIFSLTNILPCNVEVDEVGEVNE